MRLRVAPSFKKSDGEKCIETITGIIDEKDNADETGVALGVLEDQKTWPSRSKLDEMKMEDGGLLRRSNTEPVRSGEIKADRSRCNTYLEVNVLHLSIIAQQTASIQWIMDNISIDSARFCESLKMMLNDRIFLENAKLFGTNDQSLHGMNALHLSSQYFSEAMKIIFETIYKYGFLHANLLNIVQDNENSLKLTPLHIAARKSSLKAAKYV